MESLHTVTKMLNTEADCPARINRCELLFDAENIRMLLMLKLDFSGLSSVLVDVCCYDKEGVILSVMKNVPYKDGGMFVELTSLMTAHTEVILRSAETENGVWKSTAVFPEVIGSSSEFDETSRFNPIIVAQPETPPVPATRAEKRRLKKEKAAAEEELRQMIKNDPREKRRRIITRVVILLIIAVLLTGGAYAFKYKSDADAAYTKAMNLYNSGRFEDAIGELENASGYFYTKDKSETLSWSLAISYSRQRNFIPAAAIFKEFKDSKEGLSNYRSIIHAYSGIISAGEKHTVALSADGTVTAIGDNSKKQCETDDWLDIIRVTAGKDHTLGLTRDGEVVSTGDNEYKQCETKSWRNIIDIACGDKHSVAAQNTGRAVAIGDNTYGQCDVDKWSGIVAVSASSTHTVGLKIDGTVTAAGDNQSGQCDVSHWRDIAMVTAGDGFTAALKYDGSILIAGDDRFNISNTQNKGNVLAIAAGSNNLLVLQTDGRVISYGSNDSNQGMTEGWNDVISVAGGERHSVCVLENGSVLAAGDNKSGQVSLDSLKDIGLPKSTVSIRKDNES